MLISLNVFYSELTNSLNQDGVFPIFPIILVFMLVVIIAGFIFWIFKKKNKSYPKIQSIKVMPAEKKHSSEIILKMYH